MFGHDRTTCPECLIASGEETRANLGYGEDEDLEHDFDGLECMACYGNEED